MNSMIYFFGFFVFVGFVGCSFVFGGCTFVFGCFGAFGVFFVFGGCNSKICPWL